MSDRASTVAAIQAASTEAQAIGVVTPPPPPTAGLGQLVHDGPPTPEQISLYLPVTGALASDTAASVRYRPTAGTVWIAAHPLHRIRPADTAVSSLGVPSSTPDAFAGVITGLSIGASYTVEVTIGSVVKTLVAVTRPLPAPAGAASKVIAAGTAFAQIQAVFDQANPGDVIQFSNGTYAVNANLLIRRSGTPTQPIYIRGESRTGVILKGPSALRFEVSSDVVVEFMTWEGSKVDSGVAASSRGASFWASRPTPQQRITFRNLTLDGVDMGVVATASVESVLVYDNTMIGNNRWTQDLFPYNGGGAPGAGDGTLDINQNIFWNDDAIRIPGKGNAAFNNTMSGFGDAGAVNSSVDSVGVHFYRNEISESGDDSFEGDFAVRNITFYDNRVHNAMTLISFDPLYGGPAFCFRNIGINIGRSPYKFNAKNTGMYVYNNTVVRTEGVKSGLGWGWNQSNNGPLAAWGYRNNILIYRGAGNLMAMESSGQDPIDFTHNAWFPDKTVKWSNWYTSMAEARSKLPATKPVFSGSTKRHEGDVITESDPFVVPVVLGADYLTQITERYVPALAPGSAPYGKGVAIPGITDGFSGSAPDMGAVISGVPVPVWGDRTS